MEPENGSRPVRRFNRLTHTVSGRSRRLMHLAMNRFSACEMVSIQKTASSSILAVQTVTSNTVAISSVQSLLTKLAATVFIHFGRAATTALTEGAELRVEASSQASGDGFWF